MNKAIEVFISYSHKDEEHFADLKTHLSVLLRQGLIDIWHDRQIGAGTDWKEQIDAHLNSAELMLALISADFLASDYCYEKEMQRALQRAALGEAQVIPIIVRPSDWQSTPLGDLQALPKNGKAITTWTNRDEAMQDVVQGIRKVVNDKTATSRSKAVPGAVKRAPAPVAELSSEPSNRLLALFKGRLRSVWEPALNQQLLSDRFLCFETIDSLLESFARIF